MRIRTQCRDCGYPFRAEIVPAASDGVEGSLACPACGAQRAVSPRGWVDGPRGRVHQCPLCGCRHLYRQRDVHRGWGCALVALGAILVPWTYGLSLVVLAAVDWWLYRRLREAVVCYRCDTVYRDAVPTPQQGDFDLLRHDVLKYGKSWESVDEKRGQVILSSARGATSNGDRRPKE